MRAFVNLCIVILVVFSISTETYMYASGNVFLPQLYNNTYLNRIIYYYSYFTVLSNLTVGISSFILLIKPNFDSKSFRILRLDGLICIIITSVVYNFILRQNHPPKGIMIVTNEFLHLVIPILTVVSWVIYGPRKRMDKTTMYVAIMPPLLYVIYTFIRGHVTNIYPYPFLDAGIIGLPLALLNTGVVIILFLIIEIILFFLDKKISFKRI